MSRLFEGSDPAVAIGVAASDRSRPEQLVHVDAHRGRRCVVAIAMPPARARELACAILEACDYLDGADWTLQLDGVDSLERLLVRRARRARPKARRRRG